ncbi:30S ribosomal protein S21 [Candidatus Curtissbacteria bacterium]|nr:30S ribosomal protein S21 [Candidatus Curtissbacteria bacterium]
MATKVTAQAGESVESLIRKFNRKVQAEGIIAEIRRREYYLKPSLKKQQKIQLARKASIRAKSH